MWTTAPSPYLLITVNIIQLEKVYVSAIQILRLFVNTSTPNSKYSFLNRDKLTQPIQILLSQKENTFFEFFPPFRKSTLNFEHFRKKGDFHSRCFSEITDSVKGD